MANASAGALVRAAQAGADDGRPLAANLAPKPRRHLIDTREFELLGRRLALVPPIFCG